MGITYFHKRVDFLESAVGLLLENKEVYLSHKMSRKISEYRYEAYQLRNEIHDLEL